MPLADGGGAVAVAAEDLRDRRRARRAVAVVAGLGGRHLAGRAHADRVVVAAGHQGLPGGRAQRRDVEPAVAQPVAGQPLGRRHLARPAVRARRAEPHVVDQHDHHVGRSGRGPDGRIGRAEVSTSWGRRGLPASGLLRSATAQELLGNRRYGTGPLCRRGRPLAIITRAWRTAGPAPGHRPAPLPGFRGSLRSHLNLRGYPPHPCVKPPLPRPPPPAPLPGFRGSLRSHLNLRPRRLRCEGRQA